MEHQALHWLAWLPRRSGCLPCWLQGPLPAPAPGLHWCCAPVAEAQCLLSQQCSASRRKLNHGSSRLGGLHTQTEKSSRHSTQEQKNSDTRVSASILWARTSAVLCIIISCRQAMKVVFWAGQLEVADCFCTPAGWHGSIRFSIRDEMKGIERGTYLR